MDTQARQDSSEFEKMYAETLTNRLERGSVVKGKVVAIRDDSVVVDVKYKSEGVIPASEFSMEDFSRIRQGDDIEVLVERVSDSGEGVVLSRDKVLRMYAMEKLEDAFNKSLAVEGKITEKIKGGLVVNLSGVNAFLPASQVDIKPVRDLDNFIGKQISVRILKLSQQRQSGQAFSPSLVVSRRVILEEERNRRKESVMEVLKEGVLLKGIVKNITDYGVFVDLGGIDGLLHISDISWRRVNHPSEFFRIGDEHEFLVLKHDESSHKVTLGYKQKKADPWLTVDQKYSSGMRVKGQVVTITDYGIFVEVEEGLEGLVHVSELEWVPRSKHPSKYASIGDEIETVVISVSKDDRRMSLSLRQLSPKPWTVVAEKYKAGEQVKGKVKTITDFGAFIRLAEGVDGLVHISDLSWTKHVKHPSDVLKKGQRVDAVILSMDSEKERMALGIKQLTPDPWLSEIPAKFKLGEEFSGKVIKVVDFGVFVELEGGVEGLIYSSEIESSTPLEEGSDIRIRIIKINTDDRKIGLSMKNVKADEN
ncbi:MAG: 30S ribosomal protein S1 [Dissulfurispiraceae bacterium]|jgi:small subunit ribosomal protein S1|nr:30S ribosomal protein S1 [Dissulfurispiraceae bacterium]